MISDKIAKKKSKQQQTTFGETSLQNTLPSTLLLLLRL